MKKKINSLKNILASNKKIVLLSILGLALVGSLAFAANKGLLSNIFTNEKLIVPKGDETYYGNEIVDLNATSSSENASSTATSTATTTEEKNNTITKYGKYLEIKDSCTSGFGGTCVRARACPSVSCPVLTSLRDGVVLRTTGETIESDGITWYKVIFDEWVRYPERLSSEFYVASDYVKIIDAVKTKYTKDAKVENLTNKEIIVNLTKQKLYAYDGDELFMEVSISSGLDDLPTPRGRFHIFEKTPSRYMQGPLPGISDQYYDLLGVPWTMYFTYQGGAIHGAYWHDNFGTKWSHGCVNLTVADAEKLYEWADLGTTVVVRD